jgi:transcription initiation factor TFIID subunit 2
MKRRYWKTFSINVSANEPPCKPLSDIYTEWERIKKTLEAADRSHAHAPTPANSATAHLRESHTSRSATPSDGDLQSSAKPSIKLKVGGSRSQHGDASKPSKSKPHVPTENTAVDLPPPPYVDDGSHDLLQEVIAIEMEKDAQKTSTKRKKPTSETACDLNDDDILALATPAKKEKHGSPGSSRPPEVKPEAAAEIYTGPSKSRNPIKLKIKEKSTPLPAPPSTPRGTPSRQVTPVNAKKCSQIIKLLQGMDESRLFRRPVDPIQDGCPTYDVNFACRANAHAVLRYYDEIKHPMDLKTMSDRLNEGRYSTMEQFREDMDLIFKNCRLFNPPGTYPVICADLLESTFEREWTKGSEKKLSYGEKRSIQVLLNKLIADDMYVLWPKIIYYLLTHVIAPGYSASLLIQSLWVSLRISISYHGKMPGISRQLDRSLTPTNTTP